MSYSYRYFRDPHAFSYYSPEPKCCSICGQILPGYDGPFYGLIEIAFVCEPCLHSGALETVECTTNEGDSVALLAALSASDAGKPPNDITQVAATRTAELEQRTPLKMSWQDNR